MSINVFITSGCYQSIPRSELRSYCHEMGFNPIMSGYRNLHTQISCIKAVEQADVMIAIIGAKFGKTIIPEVLSHIDIDKLKAASSDTEFIENLDQISITQSEVVKAIAESKFILTYIDERVQDAHHQFKKHATIDESIFPVDKFDDARKIFSFINFLDKRYEANDLVTFSNYKDIENHITRQIVKKLESTYREHDTSTPIINPDYDALTKQPINTLKGKIKEILSILNLAPRDTWRDFIAKTFHQPSAQEASIIPPAKHTFAPPLSTYEQLNNASGIVPNDAIKSNQFLDEKEVFCIELLNRNIYLKKSNNKITVTIDRGNITHNVITDKGKSELNDIFVTGNEQFLKEDDEKIHRFFNNDDKEMCIQLEQNNLCLRWVSGGILPIINYNERKYIPLFYRDKKPFGWNVFLGSSERQFDKDGVPNNVENEYKDPTAVIRREFEEEILVFEEKPSIDKEINRIRPFDMPFGHDSNVDKFYSKHVALRSNYDGLTIEENNDNPINCEFHDTKMRLAIKSGGRTHPGLSNVLVCFNLLELGIEVVKVIEFDLKEGNVLLDGEIITNYNELVRMPIALVSYDFLKKHFKGDFSNIHYNIDEKDLQTYKNPSMEINEPIPPEEMIVFKYDLEERLKVINHKKTRVGPKEEQRYNNSFKEYFDKANLTIKEERTKYFTPSAAKLLNLMFNQINPKKYED